MEDKIKQIAKATLRVAYQSHLRLIEELHNSSKQLELTKENMDEFTLFLDNYEPKHKVQFYMGGYFYTNSELIKELNDIINQKEELLEEFSDDLWAVKKMNVIQFLRWKAKRGISVPVFLKKQNND